MIWLSGILQLHWINNSMCLSETSVGHSKIFSCMIAKCLAIDYLPQGISIIPFSFRPFMSTHLARKLLEAKGKALAGKLVE